MFNERNMQQQLKNFQKQSQVQPQRLQAQPFPSCNVQPIGVMPQVPQQHYQQQQAQQGGYQQHYPQTLSAASPGPVRWQAQRPYQHHHQPHQGHQPHQQQQQQQHHPKNAPPPSKGGKHRAISLPTWLEKAICRSAKSSINIEAESLTQQAVRELYTRALGLVECTSFLPTTNNSDASIKAAPDASNIGCCKQCGNLPPAWVETERVSLLLLRTGVPAGMLALLWELVNCSRPGQLTRRECAALLALIALVQSGQQLVSADVLLKLPKPVAPVIDHPALVPFLHQYQQQQQRKPTNNSANDDNDDEFDDFVAAALPTSNVNNNNNFFGAISTPVGTCKGLQSHGAAIVASSQCLPAFPQQPSFQSSQPLTNSNQSNVVLPLVPTTSQSLSVPSNAVTDKRMNLPQVGRSPDMSPSLSFDNSQEDDFDDFQSATSDPSGLVSTDGSPRMATALQSDTKASSPNGNPELGNDAGGGDSSGNLGKLPGSSIRLPATPGKNGSSSGSLVDSQTNVSISLSTSVGSGQMSSEKPHSNDVPRAAGGVLQPAKLSMPTSDGDRYAAFRAFDFETETSHKVSKPIGMDLLNDAHAATEDDSFGDFCSVEKSSSAVDDEFGDFAAANFEKLTMPDVLQSIKSANNVIKRPPINISESLFTNEKAGFDHSFHADFSADFSSLDLDCDLYTKSSISNSDVHSLPNLPSDPPPNTSDWTSGFELKPSETGITDYPAATKTKKDDPLVTSTATSCSSGAEATRQGSVKVSQQQGEKKSTVSSAGPSNWSDLFGVLHDHKRTAAALPSQPASVMLWSDVPPPLPNCGDTDDLAELNNDFGEFFGPSSSVPTVSEEACSTSPAVPSFSPPKADITVAPAAPVPFRFSDCEPPSIIADCDLSAPTLESVESAAPAKGANVAAVLSTISEPLPLDKYSSIREGSGPCSGGGAEECWQRCLVGCQQLLQAGVEALELLTAGEMDADKLANTQPLRDYLAGLLEVVCVSARVRTAAQSLLVNNSLQVSLGVVTDLQDRLISTLQSVQQDSPFVECVRTVDSNIHTAGTSLESPPGDVCAVCLTLICDGASPRGLHPGSASVALSTKLSSPSPPVDPCRLSQGSSLQYGGHCYHPGCANLWLNCVDLTLPALTASSATLL